jgi:hypothetical protein
MVQDKFVISKNNIVFIVYYIKIYSNCRTNENNYFNFIIQ